MKLTALKASLALWRRRYEARLKLRARARQDLLEAREADTHPRQQLVDRKILREQQAEEARKLVVRREGQIAAYGNGKVRRPYERYKISVVCQSSRNGVKPRRIVLHDTEGANVPNSISDLVGLGGWFNRITTQASSNVAVDAEANAAQYVPDSRKAWAQASCNPDSLSIEQIGFYTQRTWPEPQLRKVAQYIAYWSKKYDIPIVFSTTHGVCEHRHLGAAGGGHIDCGTAYPLDRVLELARGYLKDGW